ncbi:LysE family translocator [Pseudomonas viridiflava]|uniref:LysE family translocator n=1 Tax=Pseudomonas viridiflava TaxID=33069 RepID=UPI000F027EDC|nr:LysE family translocator [Pseudomonas viridiflava]
MGFGLVFAMSMFSLGMAISPGPVNMATVASGANHGFVKTVPFLSGATFGLTVLLILIGFGLLTVIDSHPLFFEYLSVAGSAFIIYMGYKIASSRPDLAVEKADTPDFIQGFMLQLLNPKAWIACASGVVSFSTPQSNGTLITFIVIYSVICFISLSAWAVLGDRVSALLNSAFRIRAFNLTMGGMLILTACYLLSMQLPTPSVLSQS